MHGFVLTHITMKYWITPSILNSLRQTHWQHGGQRIQNYAVKVLSSTRRNYFQQAHFYKRRISVFVPIKTSKLCTLFEANSWLALERGRCLRIILKKLSYVTRFFLEILILYSLFINGNIPSCVIWFRKS